MREINAMGLSLCSFQAKIFEKTLDYADCSSAIFIRRFMNSDLVKRIDNGGVLFEAIDFIDAINEIETQYGVSEYGKIKYSREELYWIGYIYRYWSYVTEMTSKQIYKIAKAEELRKLYFPYHSLDPMQAIERILEAKNIDISSKIIPIEKGVLVLRKIRNKNQQQ